MVSGNKSGHRVVELEEQARVGVWPHVRAVPQRVLLLRSEHSRAPATKRRLDDRARIKAEQPRSP